MFALIAALGAEVAAPAVAPSPEIIIVTASPLSDSSDALGQGVALVARSAALKGALSGGIGEALAQVPGVRSTFYGPNAARPIIRGLGEDRIRLLLNGLTGIDASTLSPDHAPAIDGLDADQIEVLKGPAALRFGSNAIGGVVNIVDGRLPTQMPAPGLTGEAFVGGSSAEGSKAAAVRLRKAAGAFVFRIDGLARSSSDYRINGFAQTPALREQTGDDTFGKVFNTRGDIWAIGASAARISDKHNVAVSVRNTRSNYGIPGEEAAIDLKQTRLDGLLSVKDVWAFDSVSLSGSGGDYRHSEIAFDGTVGTVFSNKGYEGRLEARLKPIGRLDGLVGAQFGSVDVAAQGDEAFILPVTVEQSGVFAFQRYAHEQWGGEIGARAEQRRYRGEAGRRAFDLNSASASVFVKPVSGLRLSASFARTERAPTEVELFANGPHAATQAYEIGDPKLKREVATSVEGSASLRYKGWTSRLDVWQAEFDGFISFVPTGDMQDELNLYNVSQKDATLRGYEFGVSGPLWTMGQITISADVALDYVRGKYQDGGPIPRMPPPQLNFGLTGETGAVKVRGEVQRLDAQTRLADYETPTSGATLYHLSLAWTPLADKDGLELVLEGRNLTDVEVREHTSFLKDSVPRPGRSIKLGLRARF